MSGRGDMTTLPPSAEREARRSRPRREPAASAEPAGAAGSVAQLRPPRPRGRTGQRPPGATRERPPGTTRERPPGTTGLRQPPGGPGSGASPASGVRPGTRTRRARPPAAARRPAPAPAGRPAARPGAPEQESRTRFVFLVLGLLGGGLICLLLINTVLASGALKITALQTTNVQIAQQTQELRARIAAEETPAALYRRARQLGMAEPPLTHFLDLRKGRIISQPGHVRGVVVYPPGYVP